MPSLLTTIAGALGYLVIFGPLALVLGLLRG